MANLPFSTQLGPGIYNITAAQRLVNISVKGGSATASEYLGNTQITGLPAPASVPIGNGEVIANTGGEGGFVQNVKITVPVGGLVYINGEQG